MFNQALTVASINEEFCEFFKISVVKSKRPRLVLKRLIKNVTSVEVH